MTNVQPSAGACAGCYGHYKKQQHMSSGPAIRRRNPSLARESKKTIPPTTLMAPKLLSLIGTVAVLVCMCRSSQAAPATFDSSYADQPVYFPDYTDRVEKREWPFRRLLPHNPILIYHQSIRQPRYLAQAVASAHNEPNSDIPRRLIRRGNGTIYKPSRVIAWNHQLLPTFNKFNLFRPNVDGRTTNNKRDNDWTSRLAARSLPFSFPVTDNGLDDASRERESGNPSTEYDDFQDDAMTGSERGGM